MPEFVLTLDVPQLLNLLLAVVFPVLVGLVTTKITSSILKAVLLATISLASGLVSALLAAVLAGVPFDIVAALLTGLAAWIIAIATHLGFWKPSGVTEKVQALGADTDATAAQHETYESIAEVPGVLAVDGAGYLRKIPRHGSGPLRRDLRG